MNNLNLIKILKTFSKSDMSEFDKFLRSPFYNNQSTLVRLFKAIKKFHPEFNSKNFNQSSLYSSVNPGKPYNSLLFRKYISSLTKLAEKYLHTVKFSKNKMSMDLELLEYYAITGLNNLYFKKDKEISDLNFKGEKISLEYSMYKIIHSEINYNFLSRNHGVEDHFRSKSLELVMKNDLYVFINFLVYYSNNLRKLYMHKYYFDISETSAIFNKLFSLIKIEDLEVLEKQCSGNDKIFLKLIRFDIMMSTEKFDDITLRNMRKTVFKCASILNNNLLYYYFARMNTFCSAKITSKNEYYNRILFENYKYMIDMDLFFSDGNRKFNLSEYQGIIYFALKAKEFDWTERFIAKCKKLDLLEDFINVEMYSRALLSFYKNDHENCINFSSKVNLKNFFLRYALNKITLKSMYELNYLEMAENYSKNYKRFIMSQLNISDDFRKKELKFLEYFNLLINKKNDPDKYLPKNFISKLGSDIELKGHEWIFKKFNLLLKAA